MYMHVSTCTCIYMYIVHALHAIFYALHVHVHVILYAVYVSVC